MKAFKSIAALSLLLAYTSGASAGIIPLGSSFTLHPTNAPDTYSDTTTFGGTVLVDGGAAQLAMTQLPDGANAEWDIWTLTTTDGSPIAGNIDAFWNIVMDYILGAPAFFDGVVNQWLVDGTPVSPINNFGGLCCAVADNPATGGAAYYNASFSAPFPAGPQDDWQQIFVNPYNFVSAGGIDPNTANGFTWALHFTLQDPITVPEPSSLVVLGGGMLLLGLAFARRYAGSA